MTWIDWLIVIVPTLVIIGFAVVLQRYVRSVADFMAASRVAGRYLLTNANAEMGLTVVGAVAVFESVQKAGFTMVWWAKLSIPISLILMLWGFVIYRYRETRVMTLAQFFELRYSKRFRIFAGFLGFASGTINYGIFPALAARFFIYFCGLPVTVPIGHYHVPMLAIIMAMYLTLSLSMTLTGGHLTIMVTDCIGSLITVVFYTVIIIVLMWMFHWSQIFTAMSNTPPGQSLFDPFDTLKQPDFNIWFVLINVFAGVYGFMTWQGGHAFNSCAINAHEARMANILGRWRGFGQALMFTLLPICAYTFLHHPDFAAGAARARAILGAVPEEQIRTQVTSAVALGQLMPIGVKGMMTAVFLLGLIACDGSYLHSWGSIFIQDVIVPLRKKPFTPRQHLWILRTAVFGVALFGFLFSLFYRQTQYVLMFFAITGAIYVGGAGAVLLGGLYWKKGTTAGAWSAMLAGSFLAVFGLVINEPFVWEGVHHLLQRVVSPEQTGWLANLVNHWPAKFPINGQYMYFIAMMTASVLYITISLLTCKVDFNMDRMLHRGKYAVEPSTGQAPVAPPRRSWIQRWVGIDENFTRGDRILAWSVVLYSMFWFVLFVVITGWNFISRWPVKWWATYWRYELIIMPVFVMVLTTVWFWWGGVRDLGRLFQRLRTVKRNELDDGRVIGHRNADEELEAPQASK